MAAEQSPPLELVSDRLGVRALVRALLEARGPAPPEGPPRPRSGS